MAGRIDVDAQDTASSSITSTTLGQLTYILRSLAVRDAVPKHVQLTAVAGGFFASVFDRHEANHVISQYVCMGFAHTAGMAAMKGVVEWLERAAFHEGARRGIPSCQTKRSDGFAAFPMSSELGRAQARQNAYDEAVERYVWATWWDNLEVGHRLLPPEAFIDHGSQGHHLLEAARQQLAISRFEVIVPYADGVADSSRLAIVVAHLEDGGAVTGGAVGDFSLPTIWERAAAELFRHCLALRRMASLGSSGSSFYQQRLFYFGSGKGKRMVDNRLSARGNGRVVVPALDFDEEIAYRHSDLVCVHRCLLHNQPVFIGGALERLCI